MNKSSSDSYSPTSLPPTQPPYDVQPTEPDQPEQYPEGLLEDLTTQSTDQEPIDPTEVPENPQERLIDTPEEPEERSENPTERQEEFTERAEETTERQEEQTETQTETETESPEEAPERRDKFIESPNEPTEKPEEPMEIPEEPVEVPEERTEILEKQLENPEKPTLKLENPAEIPEESQRFDFTEMPNTTRPPEYYNTIIRNPSIPPRPVEEVTSEPPFKRPMKITPYRSSSNKTVMNKKQEFIKESHISIDSNFQQVLSKLNKTTIICIIEINSYIIFTVISYVYSYNNTTILFSSNNSSKYLHDTVKSTLNIKFSIYYLKFYKY